MNPLESLACFLHYVGVYTDPDSSFTREEQIALTGCPLHLTVPHFYKSHTAFPGVPMDHLLRAFVYVEHRIGLIEGGGHRARASGLWLSRWSSAIMAEIKRRDRDGDLPPPAVRDGLLLTYEQVLPRSRHEIDPNERLLPLVSGEWWLDPNVGVPYFQAPPKVDGLADVLREYDRRIAAATSAALVESDE